ncbi:MAG: DUF4625 domain-containing protein [Pedobacter sp.]|nr:MAG: DUF4625 domain-containing protein [Pedobacter sp.]
MMNKITKPFLALMIIAATFTACKKDEAITDPPTITNLEVGTSNNKTAYPGTDIHFEADLFAASNLASIDLTIKPKTGTGWNFNQNYTEGFANVKNASFHKHIDVPTNAALGSYIVTIKVTDQLGRTTEVTSDLEIKYDPTLPNATGFEVGLNTAGNDLHVEATLSAINKIARVEVEVHGSAWETDFLFTDVAMVGLTSYNFHKHLDVTAAPKGHYHVHLKIVDQLGKENEFEEHFDK